VTDLTFSEASGEAEITLAFGFDGEVSVRMLNSTAW